jgi:hypothetical protein
MRLRSARALSRAAEADLHWIRAPAVVGDCAPFEYNAVMGRWDVWMGTALAALAMTTMGCGGEEPQEPQGPVTWHADVAPLVTKHCGSCHGSSGLAPFDFSTFDTVSALSGAMLSAIDEGSMPPWLAHDTEECAPLLPWVDDLRLSEEQKTLFRQWVDDGALEGDAGTASELPTPPSLEVEEPDVSAPFEASYTVDGEADDFQCFVIDPGNTEKVWVTQAQLIPGNEKVDHHGIMFVDFAGESDALIESDGRFDCFNPPSLSGYILATWTPGAAPFVMPADSGMPLPAGARIVVQMHYHPTGKGPEQDRSTVQLKWISEQPTWEGAQALIGNMDDYEEDGTGLQPGPNDPADGPAFLVPAMAANHRETMIFKQDVPFTFPIFSMGTHMHYVGRDMKIDLKRQTVEPLEQCLIQTPEWDFNWQRVYNYDASIDDLPRIGPGDELHLRCDYDNTLDNPFVAAALKEQGIMHPTDVSLGDETLDEMCIGLVGILMPPGIVDELF